MTPDVTPLNRTRACLLGFGFEPRAPALRSPPPAELLGLSTTAASYRLTPLPPGTVERAVELEQLEDAVERAVHRAITDQRLAVEEVKDLRRSHESLQFAPFCSLESLPNS